MDSHQIHDEFQVFVNEKSVAGSNGLSDENCHYIPRHRLEEFWTAEKVEGILSNSGPKTLHHLIRSDYLRVFSILVHLSEQHRISEFIRREVDDSNLPLGSPIWPYETNHQHKGFADTIQRFYNVQWQFCPLGLSGQSIVHKRDLHPRHVLPFIRTQPLGSFGDECGQVYKVEIQDIDQSPEKTKLPGSFALKKFSLTDHKKTFDNEVRALAALARTRSDHIVMYYGSFIQGDTCNILLEHVTGGTLEDFLQKAPPPSSPYGVISLWDEMLSLASTLNTVHNTFVRDARSEVRNCVVGIHGDIKPDNILWFKDDTSDRRRFKIADFGLADVELRQLQVKNRPFFTSSRTEALPNSQRNAAPTDGKYKKQANLCPGSAPDWDGKRPTYTLDQHFSGPDIWALGCVMSEFAVWLQRGYEGVESFRQSRRDELSIKNLRYDYQWPGFHDGSGLLSAVEKIFEEVRDWLILEDSSGGITRNILDMLQKDVLVRQNQGRIRAKEMLKVFQYHNDGEKELEGLGMGQRSWGLDNKAGSGVGKMGEQLRWGYSVKSSLRGY